MAPSSGPKVVVWDTTYACPLRCVHCYSESGRRPPRRLSPEDMVTVVDRIIELRPSLVDLTGSPEVRARIDARPEYLVTAGRG